MEFLKTVFGDKPMTYAELEAALKDNKNIKLANLAGGQYVDKDKLDTKISELAAANETIKNLQETVKKFDGVDVQKLKEDLAAAQVKYDADLSKARLESALEIALVTEKGKNTKAIKALLDIEKIKLDGDKLLGLDSQLEALKKSDAYLFEDEEKKETKVKVDSGQKHDKEPDSGGPTLADEIKTQLYGSPKI
jgi:hypothetical protein